MRDDPLHYIGQVLAHLGHDLVVSVTEVEGETILYLSQPLTTELTPHLRLIASGHTVHWRKLPALGEGNFCTVGLTSGESQDRDCIARAARVLEGAGVDICRALAPNLAATA